MKKTLLALTISTISFSSLAANTSSENSKPTFEFDSMHKDQFSVAGTVGVGGYYDTKTDAFYDDWATAITLAVNYKNNRLLGYLEVDLEANYNTDTDRVNIPKESGLNTDIDKAWIGFDTDFGIASIGWENDTALDRVDGAGDFTYELGSSVSDGDDAFNVVKFQGDTLGIAYAVSYFETDNSHKTADKGVNGYLGYEHEVFNVYVGYEDRDDADFDLMTLTGNVSLDSIKLGMNLWKENGQQDVPDNTDNLEEVGYYTSIAYSPSSNYTFATGYAHVDEKSNSASTITTSYVNIAAMYDSLDKFTAGVDIRRDLDVNSGENKETYVFASAFYYF